MSKQSRLDKDGPILCDENGCHEWTEENPDNFSFGGMSCCPNCCGWDFPKGSRYNP